MDQKPKKSRQLDIQVVITQDDSPAKVEQWRALWKWLLAPAPTTPQDRSK